VLGLVDARDVLGNCGFSKNIESLEDALIGEVQATVTVAAVLLGGLFEGTFLGNMSLFVAVVAEVIAASASQDGTLYWASTTWGQGHPVLGCYTHWSVGDMRISNLFQCLYLFHPSLHPIHLHVDCEQGT